MSLLRLLFQVFTELVYNWLQHLTAMNIYGKKLQTALDTTCTVFTMATNFIDLDSFASGHDTSWLWAAILCPYAELQQTFFTYCWCIFHRTQLGRMCLQWFGGTACNIKMHEVFCDMNYCYNNFIRRRVFKFAACVPGEGGAGEGAGPLDESVWRKAHGGVQGRNVQRWRSVRSSWDSTLPGALQLCRRHASCRGERKHLIRYRILILLSYCIFLFLQTRSMKRPRSNK